MADDPKEPQFDTPEDLLAAIREQQDYEGKIESEIDSLREQLKEQRANLKLTQEKRVELVELSKKLFPER